APPPACLPCPGRFTDLRRRRAARRSPVPLVPDVGRSENEAADVEQPSGDDRYHLQHALGESRVALQRRPGSRLVAANPSGEEPPGRLLVAHAFRISRTPALP